MKRFLGKLPGRLLVYVYALIVVVPLYFVLVTAFKTVQEIAINPFGLPAVLHWENFAEAWVAGNLGRAFSNSLLIAIIATVMQMLMAIIVSFCLYRTARRKLGIVLYMIVMITLFIPGTGWVSLLRLYQDLHLYNNIWGVILNSGTGRLAFNMFILVGAMRGVPREMEEAAILDGCNDWQFVFKVQLPCIKPSVISIGIFSFTTVWNSLMVPMLLLRDKAAYTLPLALKYFVPTEGGISYNYVFAGIIISGLPLVIAYLFCQKYFVAALTGSVKG